MKYFLDTEFIEDGKTIDLISIAIACEDDRTLYLQNSECNFQRASDWVWRNVFPNLIHFDMSGKRSCFASKETYDLGLGQRTHTRCNARSTKPVGVPCPWARRFEIEKQVMDFLDVAKYGEPEIWGYYADYDWVVFCQLFGAMMELPKGLPRYCRDLKQLLDSIGNPRIQTNSIHHALSDALWIKETYESLSKLKPNA